MMKTILKKLFPLPAAKQNEMEARISGKIEQLLEEVRALGSAGRQQRFELPEAEWPRCLREWYRAVSGGKELDLENPKTFCEKLNWLKLYDRNPMKSLLSDKYLAPQYVRYVTGGRCRTPLCLGMWENACDINFSLLPERFVLKCNHGSSMNIIVDDKRILDIRDAVKKLNGWLRTNYTAFGDCLEWQYSDIKPRIVAEEFLDDGSPSPLDYKVHCFNGEPKMVEVQSDHYNGEQTSTFLDLDWKRLDIKRAAFRSKCVEDFTKPKRLDDMLDFARLLSKDFIYVRMDFYYVADEIYFGEYTFTPACGWLNFENPETDIELGRLLRLPSRQIYNKNVMGGGEYRIIFFPYVSFREKYRCVAA